MIASRKLLDDVPRPAAYLLALVFSLLTTGGLLLFAQLQPINKTTIALIYLLPVGFSTTYWGLLPGVTAAFASFLAFNYFFIQPLRSLTVHSSEDLVILFAFFVVAIVISELVGRIKRNLAAASAREREAIQLYELSKALWGLMDEGAIAQALAVKISETLRPDRVEVMIESRPRPVLAFRATPSPSAPAVRPQVVPIQTARELLGEIRLWRSASGETDTDERLASMFASQAVLAIERVRLAEEARKARLLEESDRFKSSLLSSVSHELRSPLAAIKAAVSSLRTRQVERESAAGTDLLTTVDEEIDHLNILVGNLLDMSRIEAGALQPQKKPNLLSEILASVLGYMRGRAQSHEVRVTMAEDLPLVSVDFVQISQVFTNLLTNSIKYSPPGSTISISAKQIDKQTLLVTVANQGPPVPAEHLERIFDKFHRVTATERVTGTGLGLSICKGIVEAHGGRIWAENLVDGLAFNFTLPVNG